ncbi:heterokaryon incompatibility protein-domain-containing protein, partial [Cercophora newfieldiana]
LAEIRRLVQAPPDCSFVALGYVWGRNPDPKRLVATTSTMQQLQSEGGLLSSKMSATIEDAVEACRKLGQDYLWVDRLCIIQDDPQDKEEQIAAMAAVFWLATLAIVVTDGDSYSGIAGNSQTFMQRSPAAAVGVHN